MVSFEIVVVNRVIDETQPNRRSGRGTGAVGLRKEDSLGI
jgi:hypothetical protein